MALKAKILKPSDFINPLLSKKKIDNSKFENFKTVLEKYTSNIKSQHSTKQSEPNIVANALKPFFEELNFNAQSFSQKGQSGIDLAIMKDFKPCVILEAKKHNDTDMINKENLHKKSLYESILYFLRERDEGNKEIFHIIITDFYSWFIFDAKDFDRLFWQNSSIKKIYKNYKNPNLLGNNTKDFYEDIEKELNKNFMENLLYDKEIPCAYFNLLEPKNEKDLQNIYKLLSSDTLLKEFNPNDANSLNKDFYNELLYILGLEEKKDKNISIFSQNNDVVLKVESDLDKDSTFLNRLDHPSSYILKNETIENVVKQFYGEEYNVVLGNEQSDVIVNILSGKIMLTYKDIDENQIANLLTKVEVELVVEIIKNGVKTVKTILMDNKLGIEGKNYRLSITSDDFKNIEIKYLNVHVNNIIEVEIYKVLKDNQ